MTNDERNCRGNHGVPSSSAEGFDPFLTTKNYCVIWTNTTAFKSYRTVNSGTFV